jgi:hypothetical protein
MLIFLRLGIVRVAERCRAAMGCIDRVMDDLSAGCPDKLLDFSYSPVLFRARPVDVAGKQEWPFRGIPGRSCPKG